MLVRNITGIPQMDSPGGTVLYAAPPGEWTELPYDVAIRYWKNRVVEVKSPTDLKDHLWKNYLFWMSPFSLGDGYATAAENMVLALKRQHLQIYIAPCWFVSRKGLQEQTVQMLDAPLPGPIRVGLCMATPGEFKKLPTPYRIGLTMYEADDPLKNLPEWRHDCRDVDMLIVPSEYCRRVFGAFVERPIHVVPLAVNTAYYVGPTHHKRPKDLFVFGMHGTLTGRKAPLEVIELFSKVFPIQQYPKVRLQLKTRLSILGWSEGMLPTLTDPRIQIINANWELPRMVGWLTKMVDCYIYPSKGEGFGLPPREAMAAGCPTIFSHHTGMEDLANSDFNWPILTHHEEDSPLGGKWRIPDWDAVAEHMKWIYNNREEAYRRACEGSKWFIANKGADAAAAHLKSVLEAVDPEATRPLPFPQETLENNAGTNHVPFYGMIHKLVDHTSSPILDVGFGEGLLYQALVKMGYNVVAVIAPGTRHKAATKLLAKGLPVNLIEHNILHLEQLKGKVDVAACISQSVLHRLQKHELEMVLMGMLALSPTVLFSVPTVFYPDEFEEGACLRRRDHWMDLLYSFAAETQYYGDKRYLWGHVLGLDHGVRGTMVKTHYGRVIDHTWHPLPLPDAQDVPTRGEKT